MYKTLRVYRYTPLHLAASRGDVDCVRALLNQNADINAIDEFGKTPMRTAELIGKQTVVKVLKSEGMYIFALLGNFNHDISYFGYDMYRAYPSREVLGS